MKTLRDAAKALGITGPVVSVDVLAQVAKEGPPISVRQLIARSAYSIDAPIRDKWAALGWEASVLGSPTTDTLPTGDGVGRFNDFDNGSIYWKPPLGAHEIDGPIREFWRGQGGALNPVFGYPISDVLSAKNGTYSDFENGVVSLPQGAQHAGPVPKFTLNNASKSVDDVSAKLSSTITAFLAQNDKIYITNEPSLAGVTDYSLKNGSVHNREYHMHVDLGVHVPLGDNPTVNLDLFFELSYDPGTRRVRAYLADRAAHYATTGFVKQFEISAAELQAKFEAQLDPLLWKPNNESDPIPDILDVLSMKVMPNGDFNVYLWLR